MLAHKYVMKLGATLIASGTSFVSLMVMTRYVSDQYGLMMWAWSFVSMFYCLVDMGFNMTNVKYVSEGRDRDKCFSTYLAIKLILGIIMVVATLSTAYVSLLVSHTMDREAFMVVIVFTIHFFISDMQNVMAYTLDGRKENGKTALLQTIEFSVRSVCLIVLALMEVSAVVLSLGYVVGMITSFITCIFLFRHPRVHLVRPAYLRDYVSFAAPIAISILLMASVEYLDKVIIGFSFGTDEVGFYTAAAGVVWTFTNLGRSLNTVVLPYLADYKGEGGLEVVQDMVWKTERYLAIATFPVIIMMLFFGEDIAVVLFGSEFGRSGEVMAVQSIMIYAIVITALMTQLLYSTNHASTYGKCSFLYVGFVILGYMLLIPRDHGLGLGAVGAGLALSLGFVFYAFVLSYAVWRCAGIRFYGRLWRHIVASAVTSLVIVTVGNVFDVHGLIPLILLSLLCVLVHVGACALVGEFSKGDLRFVLDSVNPSNLKESINEEMK